MLEHGRLTIAEYQKLYPEMSRRTLQRDLRALVEKGLLRRREGTNRLEYVLANGSG